MPGMLGVRLNHHGRGCSFRGTGGGGVLVAGGAALVCSGQTAIWPRTASSTRVAAMSLFMRSSLDLRRDGWRMQVEVGIDAALVVERTRDAGDGPPVRQDAVARSPGRDELRPVQRTPPLLRVADTLAPPL